MTEQVFDVDYFIKKFEAIPDEKWCTGMFSAGDKHCAVGHCQNEYGALFTDESAALANVFQSRRLVFEINDGLSWPSRTGILMPRTPKERILTFLRTAKRHQPAL